MFKSFQKTIIFLSCILSNILLISGCGANHFVSSNTLDKKNAKEFIQEKQVIASISQIEIDARYGDIELIPSDHYYIEINYLYWKDKPNYYVKDGTLHFDDNQAFPRSFSLNFEVHNYIKVYLPENAKIKQIELDDSSGDITVKGCISDILKLNASYGDIFMDNVVVNEATINLSSGTSDVKNTNFSKLKYSNSYGDADFINVNGKENSLSEQQKFEEFRCQMSSGDVTIKGLNCDSIDLDNSYGDIDCNKINGSQLDADLSSGDFEIRNSDVEEIRINNSYGDAAFHLAGSYNDYNMDFDTSYGKIRVEDRLYKNHASINNNSPKEIQADLSSGDIEVYFEH